MRVINPELIRYRTAAMALWNLTFMPTADEQIKCNMGVLRDWFGEVEGHLFCTTVCRSLRCSKNHAFLEIPLTHSGRL